MKDKKYAVQFEPRYENLLVRFKREDLVGSVEWQTVVHYLELLRNDLVDGIVQANSHPSPSEVPAFLAGEVRALDNLRGLPEYLESLSQMAKENRAKRSIEEQEESEE